MQYIALIHDNAASPPCKEEWSQFITKAVESGMFQGGSEIGRRQAIGNSDVSQTSHFIVGFMRFDTDDFSSLRDLLDCHPVVKHGGTVEICEMPKS